MTLTDRYVAATLNEVPDSQRLDVERELRASIADAIEAQTDSGVPEDTAERAVLTDLGDPSRLAASYAERPLYLIGPATFLAWRRLLVTLLWIVVPIATLGVFTAQAIASGDDPAWASRAFAAAITTALTTALHIAFWTTLVFALVERYPTKGTPSLTEWNLDMLPIVDRRKLFNDTVASIVFTVLFVGAFLWQQFGPIAFAEGSAVRQPLLDPELWSFWLPYLMVVLAASIPLSLIVYRRGGWEYVTAAVKVALDLAFAIPVVTLALRGELLNPGFFEAVGWPDAALLDGLGASGTADPVTLIVIVLAIVILVWDAVDTFVKARRDFGPRGRDRV